MTAIDREPRITVWSHAICVLLLVTGVIGCDQRTGSDAGRSDTLTIHVADQDERALGPLGMLWFLVFLGLTEGQEGIEGSPRLLDRWEHSADFTDWTLHVREGLLWGDGEPVTAEDVVFSLELWTHENVMYEYPFFDSLEVTSSHTLRMTFPEPPPASPFTYNWLAMVPEHVLADNEVDELFSWPFWVRPVGNGPFRYVRHIADVMTELEPNPLYYGERPSIDRVVLRYGGNAVTELLSGNVDIASGIDPLQAGSLIDDPRFRLYHQQLPTDRAIAWNHDNPLFQDVAVRRALTLAIDRRGLLRTIHYPEEVPIFDVPIRWRHHEAGVVPEPLPYDPAEAERLLTQAGWNDTDGDGVRERGDREFRFALLATPETSAEAVFLEAAFRRVGVASEIRTLEGNMHRDRLRSRDFDAALYRYNYVEAFDDFRTSGYRNAEIERLRDDAWFTIDRERADEALFAMWEVFRQELPITYLYRQLRFIVAHRRVQGLENNRDLYSQVEHVSLGKPE